MEGNESFMSREGRQKKIALINDFCGFGRCSLAVSLPIISAMGIQGCPVPTAVFSNHTAYESFYKLDLTGQLKEYTAQWKKLELSFDGVLAGYLASPEQIDMTASFVRDFLKKDPKKRETGLFILDPVMGDNGRLYPAYQSDMLDRMRKLVSHCDVLTPNLTEACFLTGTDYNAVITAPSRKRGALLRQIGTSLLEMMGRAKEQVLAGSAGKPEYVVISGIETRYFIENYLCGTNISPDGAFIRMRRTGHTRCGTGDVFSSVIAGKLLKGASFPDAVRTAAAFVKECIIVSDGLSIPLTDGVAFEELLWKLR